MTLAGLSACAPQPRAVVSLARPSAPKETPTPHPAMTPDSAAIASYYDDLLARMKARGLMRTDGGGPDAPYNARLLARNFLRIALFDEYAPGNDNPDKGSPTPDGLRRWAEPVRMALHFGATVPADERRADRAFVRDYIGRLSGLTGLQITMGAEPANFHVMVVNEDERRVIGPEVERLIPGIDPRTVHAIETMPLSTYCLVYTFTQPGRYTFTQALAVIRGEHPPLMRQACYEEELAQGLGPANDSPEARPSIFNDDQEYAFLTTQDALILRMLYDPRLQPGMTAEEAKPVVETLASELLDGHV
ncbi:MAG: DUF2927 domain-containing protein [Paracoccaceae bacterium]|nr:DUF2927 domain-containing protein [Paracoccaceae bacterium]MDE3237567.1 DUF2927 domain-containing protein [Paracoccaceae bacterium]